MKLVVCGDLHIKEEEPFFSAQKKFINWLSKHELNNRENSIIFLGDVFHRSKPSAKEYYLVEDFFMHKLKFKKIYIVHGNHTWSRKYGSALEPFKVLDNVVIYDKPIYDKIENINCAFLPHYPEYIEKITMKEKYENLEEKNFDFIFGHFHYKEFFGEKIDISKLTGKKIFGHVHIRDDCYIGVPIITRYDEKGQKGILKVISTDNCSIQNIDVPIFIDFKTITYSEKVEKNNDTFFIYDVKEAPSKKLVYELYNNEYIRNISIKKFEDNSEIESTIFEKEKEIKEYVIELCDKKNISKKLKTKLIELF